MNLLTDEWRVLLFVVVNAALAAAAWRFVSCFGCRRLDRAMDAGLLTAVAIYAAVGVPGLFGFLSATSMLAAAVVIAVLLTIIAVRLPRVPADPARISWPVMIASLLLAGYVAALLWQQRYLPPMATDALTYHLPAAVQWLQHGRIDLFQTWLFNPANTYSPLGGSVFYAWLMGPIANDASVSLGPAAMVLLLFAATACVIRGMGVSPMSAPPEGDTGETPVPRMDIAAALAGLTIALCRPVASQIDKAKDDLFLAAFFAVAVASLSPVRLRHRLAPWRLGCAIGLCLAIKYTALLALPMLLLAIDAPWRAGWRFGKHAIAIGCAAAIAGPWYVRNAIVTGNPIFPTSLLGLHALFSTGRSLELGSLRGALGVLTSGPFAIPAAFGIAAVIAWLIGVTRSARSLRRNPLSRMIAVGPAVGIAIFFLFSPYAEVRFLLPSLVLLVAAIGLLPATAAMFAASIAAIAALATAFAGDAIDDQLMFLLAGVIFAAIGVASVRWIRQPRYPIWAACALIAVLIIKEWPQFLADRLGDADLAWQARDPRGSAWQFIRYRLPAGDPVAYAGTFTVYPLMGELLYRPIVYAPLRGDLHTIADLPWLGSKLPGERIDRAAIAAETASPDRAAWLAHLRASGAKHLAVFLQDVGDPPELIFARSLRWPVEYKDDAAVVFFVPPWR